VAAAGQTIEVPIDAGRGAKVAQRRAAEVGMSERAQRAGVVRASDLHLGGKRASWVRVGRPSARPDVY
jgi:hypothetical protein